jgi:hypothetical protein
MHTSFVNISWNRSSLYTALLRSNFFFLFFILALSTFSISGSISSSNKLSVKCRLTFGILTTCCMSKKKKRMSFILVVLACDKIKQKIRKCTVIRDFLWSSIFLFLISSLRVSYSTGATSARCCKEIQIVVKRISQCLFV